MTPGLDRILAVAGCCDLYAIWARQECHFQEAARFEAVRKELQKAARELGESLENLAVEQVETMALAEEAAEELRP